MAAPHRVYHWKHGWIPLDAHAALKKAKGSHAGAVRALEKSHREGYAHHSVVKGSYGGGTHVRGLKPVALEHLPRERHIVTAWDEERRRFALLHDRKERKTATSISEDLGRRIHDTKGRILEVDHRGDLVVHTGDGRRITLHADGRNYSDLHPPVAPPAAPAGLDTRTLKPGDFVRHTGSGRRYRVTGNSAHHFTISSVHAHGKRMNTDSYDVGHVANDPTAYFRPSAFERTDRPHGLVETPAVAKPSTPSSTSTPTSHLPPAPAGTEPHPEYVARTETHTVSTRSYAGYGTPLRATSAASTRKSVYVDNSVADHIRARDEKIISAKGGKPSSVTTIGKDGVARRYAGDGSNLHSPTIVKLKAPAKPTAGELKGTATGEAPVANFVGSITGPGAFRKQLDDTLEAINNVHGDGVLPKIPVKTTSARGYHGAYRYQLNAAGTPVSIVTNHAGDHPELTLAHEIGHFLDHHAIGGKAGHFATHSPAGKIDPEMAGVVEALHNSATIRKLRSANPEAVARDRLPGASDGVIKYQAAAFRKHQAYLLTDKEIWARAYAQFIAERGGNQRMKDHLERQRTTGDIPGLPTQWPTEDFAPVSEAIARMFRSKGWMK